VVAFEYDWPESVATILVVFLVVVLLLALLTSPSRTRVGFFIERERIDATPQQSPKRWPDEEPTEEIPVSRD
jgi:hypothetical protein